MNTKEITSLLVALKKNHKEFLKDGLDITVATTNGKTWNYQTGDNSYTGGAYGMQHWSVKTLFKDTNCRALALEIVDELKGMVAEAAYWEKETNKTLILN